MSDFSIRRIIPDGTPGNEIIAIDGKMTIENAAGIRAALLEALAGGEELHLDLTGVSDIDLTGLQLICAAHISSIKHEKSFSVNTSVNEPLKSVVRHAGFLRHIGCSMDISQTCVWTGGEDRWER